MEHSKVKIKIADLCEQDIGGQSFRISTAIRKHTDHESRSFRKKKTNYLNYGTDIQFGEHDREFVAKYLREINIIHYHGRYRGDHYSGWGKINPKARWVVHQHRIQENQAAWEREKAVDKLRGACRIVSTLNLLPYVGNKQRFWMPVPLDLKLIDSLKAEHYKESEKVRIAHSPTHRSVKGTEILIATVNDLVKKGLPIELVLIERKTFAQSLALRAACDVTFDQFQLCYGSSGVEGMAFGQPVLVGMSPDTRATVQRIVGFEPFVHTTPETLSKTLEELVLDKDKRQNLGILARKYTEVWHDEPIIARRMVKLYASLL